MARHNIFVNEMKVSGMVRLQIKVEVVERWSAVKKCRTEWRQVGVGG